VDAIVRRLDRDEADAVALVDQMKMHEVEDLLEHDGYDSGAVAMAAIIYQVRIRLAQEEANQHHKVIVRGTL